MDDSRIAKLRELLEQATKLRDGANELVADLTEQLHRTTKDDNVNESAPVEPDHKSSPAT